jgi:RHS repeat-associated protein
MVRHRTASVDADEGASLEQATAWRGRRQDITGFYWMGARYYESSSGRFLSPDPYGHAASLSLYDYAGGDPINFVDPTGRLQVEQALIALVPLSFELTPLTHETSKVLSALRSGGGLASGSAVAGGAMMGLALDYQGAAYSWAKMETLRRHANGQTSGPQPFHTPFDFPRTTTLDGGPIMHGPNYAPENHAGDPSFGWILPADKLLDFKNYERLYGTQAAQNMIADDLYAHGLDANSAKQWRTTPVTAAYKDLAPTLAGTEFQAHHINQNAAFRDVIPQQEGIAVAVRGNAFTDKGSPHNLVHERLKAFWKPYQPGGALRFQQPTNGQYHLATIAAFQAAGFDDQTAVNLAERGRLQRIRYGLTDNKSVPRVPGVKDLDQP